MHSKHSLDTESHCCVLLVQAKRRACLAQDPDILMILAQDQQCCLLISTSASQ